MLEISSISSQNASVDEKLSQLAARIASLEGFSANSPLETPTGAGANRHGYDAIVSSPHSRSKLHLGAAGALLSMQEEAKWRAQAEDVAATASATATQLRRDLAMERQHSAQLREKIRVLEAKVAEGKAAIDSKRQLERELERTLQDVARWKAVATGESRPQR